MQIQIQKIEKQAEEDARFYWGILANGGHTLWQLKALGIIVDINFEGTVATVRRGDGYLWRLRSSEPNTFRCIKTGHLAPISVDTPIEGVITPPGNDDYGDAA